MSDLVQLLSARPHYIHADDTDRRQVQAVNTTVFFGDEDFEFDGAEGKLEPGETRDIRKGWFFRASGQGQLLVTQIPVGRESKPPLEFQPSVLDEQKAPSVSDPSPQAQPVTPPTVAEPVDHKLLEPVQKITSESQADLVSDALKNRDTPRKDTPPVKPRVSPDLPPTSFAASAGAPSEADFQAAQGDDSLQKDEKEKKDDFAEAQAEADRLPKRVRPETEPRRNEKDDPGEGRASNPVERASRGLKDKVRAPLNRDRKKK